MSVLQADYFDGKTSLKHPVSVMIAGGRLKIVGRDVNEEFDARGVRRSLRIADTPRWLYLPGGRKFGGLQKIPLHSVKRFPAECRFRLDRNARGDLVDRHRQPAVDQQPQHRHDHCDREHGVCRA